MAGAVRPTSQQITIGGVSQILRTAAYVPRKTNFTAQTVANPAELSRMLLELQEALHDAVGLITSCPFIGGMWLRGISLVGGSSHPVSHLLGRPYRGFVTTRIQAGSSNAYPWEVALNAGEDASKILRLQTANTSTVDLLVF
jgi:hypothetical protein